ncbi:MAG: sulfur transferase domain-containing protein [Bacteroidota bacterium]
MRTSIFCFLSSLLFVFSLNAQEPVGNKGRVEVIEDYKNLYRFDNFYLSGQPTLELLRWLKSQGVTKIINLRTRGENATFAKEAYNERAIVKELGFEYTNIPVDGASDYTPDKLQDFSALMNEDEKILIHCRSAGRVTYFFMAYLIESCGYSLNEAIEVGKEVKFTFPLEKLLDTEINMEIENEN